MYLNYKNSKITIADYDPDYGPAGADPKEFIAQNINLNLSANISPIYTVGKRYSYVFAPEDGINGSLNLTYSLTGEDPLKDYIINDSGTFTKYRTLSGNFGGLNFSSGYLTQYGVNFIPNTPVSVNAEISFFGALSGEHKSTNPNESDSIAAAIDTTIFNVQDMAITSTEEGEGHEIRPRVENIASFQYNYASEVEPSYEVGEIVPSHVVFGPKSVQATLEFDSLSGDLPIYGKTAELKAEIANPDVPNVSVTFPVSGAVSQRRIRSSVGKLISTNLNITQSFFGECPTITNPVGAHAWGSTYGLTGTNFVDVTRITIGQVDVEDFTVASNTLINFKVPDAATSSKITVFTEGCEFGTSSSSNVTITDPGIKLTSYFESNATTESYVARYLDQIIVKGEYFNDVDKVFFVRDTGPQGTTSAQSSVEADFEIMSVGSSSEAKVTVPDNCMSGHITFKSSSRNVTSTNDAHLDGRHFVPQPVITKAIITDGRALGLTKTPRSLITLHGKGFSSMLDPLNGASGRVANLKLGRLSGATSSGFQILTETGEAIGNDRLLLAAPKLSNIYSAGRITITGASGVTASAPIDYVPEVFVSGIHASISQSDLGDPQFNTASGTIGTSISITGGNFYGSLLRSVTSHHANLSTAFTVDYNGQTGIVYPDATNPTTVLTGTIPSNARSGELRILASNGEVHPSGMNFSPVLPAPVIKSVTSHSGIAGQQILLSGNYFSQATSLKLVKRSTTKAGDEILSGQLKPSSISNSSTNNDANSEIGIIHGGVSGFSSILSFSTDTNGVDDDLIYFDIPTGYRGLQATAGTAGSAGTAGTSFDIYNTDKANFLFTGHGIYDVVLECDRGNYTVSGASTSGLVVMGDPMPSGCYVNTAEINSAHHGDFVNRSVTGVVGQEVYVSGENLYPGSRLYINLYEDDNSNPIKTKSYPNFLYQAGSAGTAGTAGIGSSPTHLLSGQYTGLSFTIPRQTGKKATDLADTGLKFFIQNDKNISEIKSFGSKSWPLNVNTVKPVGPQDIFVFLPPTISGFDPLFGSEGDTVTVSGAFLTGINKVYVGETEITSDNYLKTKNASLAANWQSRDRTVTTLQQSIYGTSFTFQIPTGLKGGEITVHATGGHVTSNEFLDLIDPVPRIDGFTPKALGFNRTVHLSGSNLNQVRRLYVSGVDPVYIDNATGPLPNESEFPENQATFNPEYYVEMPCSHKILQGSSSTGISFQTPSNLAKSGYITIETKDGTLVQSSDCLYLSRIEEISPEFSFLDDGKILAKGVNLNYPGLDVRFRGASNPSSTEEIESQDYRFTAPSGTVKYHGPNYLNTTWGATGAYFYPNRETRYDSIYLTSGSKVSETKATGPHEKFFTNSHGMVVDQSPERFIVQPEISGEFRRLVPGANKTFTDGGKFGLVNRVFSVGEQFYVTGVNCFDVSRNLVGTYSRQSFSVRDGNFQGFWEGQVVSKFLTKNLSGGFDNAEKYLISNKQGGSYYDLLTGSLSGTLTGSSISDHDAGHVVLSGTFGEGMVNPLGFVGAIMAGHEVQINLSLCSKFDTNCNIEEEVILDDGLNYGAKDAPQGGSLGQKIVNCGDLNNLPENSKNAQDRINKHILKQDC